MVRPECGEVEVQAVRTIFVLPRRESGALGIHQQTVEVNDHSLDRHSYNVRVPDCSDSPLAYGRRVTIDVRPLRHITDDTVAAFGRLIRQLSAHATVPTRSDLTRIVECPTNTVLVAVRSIDLTSRPTREAANRLYEKLGFELRESNVYRLRGESH